MPGDDELAFACDVAARAAAVLAEGAFRSHSADRKNTAIDLVTEFDRRSERLIVDAIAARFPDDTVFAEEGGGRVSSNARRWLVDPLDGTTNFSHGLPFFCVSIGLEVDGVPQLGVVAAPALGWTFSAARGRGAWLDGRRLSVSTTALLSDSILATGFPYDNASSPDNNFAEFVRLYPRTQGIRRVGAAALDLAMVAAGWLDGYWEMKLKPWDSCAGIVLVEEAGGRVTDYRGAGFSVGGARLDEGKIVASNGPLHDSLLAALAAV